MLTVKTINRETNTRAYGRLSDGTPFEIVKHLGSGRFEIRHMDQGVGRSETRRTLTPTQRLVIRCHPMAVAIRAADIHAGETPDE